MPASLKCAIIVNLSFYILFLISKRITAALHRTEQSGGILMGARHYSFFAVISLIAVLSACATFDQGAIGDGPDGSFNDHEDVKGLLDSDDTVESTSPSSEKVDTEIANESDTEIADSDSTSDIPQNDYDYHPRDPGPFGIEKQEIIIDNEDATFYLPTDAGAIADGPFPLVIVHAGFRVGHGMYSHFSEHFTSHGFVVVGIEMPGVDDNHQANANHTIAVIDWLLSTQNPHVNIIDKKHIATAGHSLGGKIAIYAAALDSRISNVIAWDPVDTGGPPCQIDPVGCKRWSVTPEMMGDVSANLLIMGGMTGTGLFTCTPEGESHHSYFEETTPSALHLDFPHSDHMDWMRDGGKTLIGLLGNLICGSLGSTSFEDVHRIANQTQVAWLLKYAKNHTGLDEYLDGSALDKDINQGTVVVTYHP